MVMITNDGAYIKLEISEVYPLASISAERPLHLIPEPVQTAATMKYDDVNGGTVYAIAVNRRDDESQQCTSCMNAYLDPKGKWRGSKTDGTMSYDATWATLHRVINQHISNGDIAAIIPSPMMMSDDAFIPGAILHMSTVADHYGFAPSIPNLFMLWTD